MPMSTDTRKFMAKRLNALMETHESLNTLEKIADKSGVGFGTVRRVRKADSVDVQIGNVEKIAECFKLSLVEFVQDPDAEQPLMQVTKDEQSIINDLRSLDPDQARALRDQIALVATLKKAADESNSKQTKRPRFSQVVETRSGRDRRKE